MKDHELDIETQAFAQLHEDVRVRRVWLAWQAALSLANYRGRVLQEIKEVVALNDQCEEQQ